MTPGLGELLEYQLAAERLHDLPFDVTTRLGPAGERHTKLTYYLDHVRHVFVGRDRAEVHDKAVKTLIVYGKVQRTRGLE